MTEGSALIARLAGSQLAKSDAIVSALTAAAIVRGSNARTCVIHGSHAAALLLVLFHPIHRAERDGPGFARRQPIRHLHVNALFDMESELLVEFPFHTIAEKQCLQPQNDSTHPTPLCHGYASLRRTMCEIAPESRSHFADSRSSLRRPGRVSE